MKKDALEKLGYKLITDDFRQDHSKLISKHYERVYPGESRDAHIEIDVKTSLHNGVINADVVGAYYDPYEYGFTPFAFNYDEIKAINQIIDECEKQLRA